MAVWGSEYLPISEELSIPAIAGGRWAERDVMIELRQTRLGAQSPGKRTRSGPSVAERLQAAYLEVVAKRQGLT
jgi:hypothetical protein